MTDEEIIKQLKENKPRVVEHLWEKYNKFEKTVIYLKSKGAGIEDAEFCKDLAVTHVVNYIKEDNLLYDTSEGCILRLVMERAKLVWLKVYNENKKRYDRYKDLEAIDMIQKSDRVEENRLNAKIEIEHIKNKLSSISDICQKLLEKKYFEDLNLDEILILFPSLKNTNSLKSRIWTCLTELRNQL